MESLTKNITQTIEDNVSQWAGNMDSATIKLFYSGVIGYLGYLTFGLVGASAGVLAYFCLQVVRLKAALWAIMGSALAYKVGRRDFALVAAAVALTVY